MRSPPSPSSTLSILALSPPVTCVPTMSKELLLWALGRGVPFIFKKKAERKRQDNDLPFFFDLPFLCLFLHHKCLCLLICNYPKPVNLSLPTSHETFPDSPNMKSGLFFWMPPSLLMEGRVIMLDIWALLSAAWTLAGNLSFEQVTLAPCAFVFFSQHKMSMISVLLQVWGEKS